MQPLAVIYAIFAGSNHCKDCSGIDVSIKLSTMYIPTPQPQLWLRTITTDGQNELSRKVGIPERTLYNQIRKGRLSAENVLKIAEVYNIHPLRALIDNGYVDEKWDKDVETYLTAASPRQLADAMIKIIEDTQKRAGIIPKEFTDPIE